MTALRKLQCGNSNFGERLVWAVRVTLQSTLSRLAAVLDKFIG